MHIGALMILLLGQASNSDTVSSDEGFTGFHTKDALRCIMVHERAHHSTTVLSDECFKVLHVHDGPMLVRISILGRPFTVATTSSCEDFKNVCIKDEPRCNYRVGKYLGEHGRAPTEATVSSDDFLSFANKRCTSSHW